MKQRALAIMLLICLLFSLCACGKSNDEEESAAPKAEVETTE